MPDDKNIETLYTPIEKKEISVMGVTIVLKPISGEQYMDIAQKAVNMADGTVDRKTYMRDVIEAVVESPKPIDVTRLNPAAIVAITSEIENFLGVSEVARKKLEMR